MVTRKEWGKAGNRPKQQVLPHLLRAYDSLYIVWDEEAFKALSYCQRTSTQVADKKQ